MASKTCTKCGQELDISMFYRRSCSSDGHQAKCKKCSDEYHATNRETISKYKAAYYESHRDKYAAHSIAYRASMPEAVALHKAAYRASYNAAHREEQAAKSAAYHAAHPDVSNRGAHVRRARKLGREIEKFDRSEILTRDGGICHICHKKVDPKNWHLDHLIPLAYGGTHTRLNVAVSHPRCNLRKNAYGPAQLRLLA